MIVTHPTPDLTAYRCRGRYGWIEVFNARDRDQALRMAQRSDPKVVPTDLEFWDGTCYVPAY